MPTEVLFNDGFDFTDTMAAKPTELNLVKPTPFEELCNRIKKRNAVRDFAFFTLIKISSAYFFMRKELEMEYLPVSWEDIECIIEHIKKLRSYNYTDESDYKEKNWNPQKQKINQETVKNLISKEPYFFPPNTQELLNERLAQEQEKDKTRA